MTVSIKRSGAATQATLSTITKKPKVTDDSKAAEITKKPKVTDDSKAAEITKKPKTSKHIKKTGSSEKTNNQTASKKTNVSGSSEKTKTSLTARKTKSSASLKKRPFEEVDERVRAVLLELMGSSESDSVRVAAAKALMEKLNKDDRLDDDVRRSDKKTRAAIAQAKKLLEELAAAKSGGSGRACELDQDGPSRPTDA